MLLRLLGVHRQFALAGVVAAGLAGLWWFHQYDKARAVAAARDGFVRDVELQAAQAERNVLRRRLEAVSLANASLSERVAESESAAQKFAQELEVFERDTEINPAGVVDGDLLRRLRSR